MIESEENMNIEVTNLDKAYEQCFGIHQLASNAGQTLINEIQNTVNSLKNHWKGSDATIHINNLIKVQKALVALITDAKLVTSNAADSIIEIQKVRKSNAGVGKVDSPLSKNAPSSVFLAEISDTQAFHVVPEAKTDHMNLTNICAKYDKFITDFKNLKSELFRNWLDGSNIAKAKSNFKQFLDNSDVYKGYLKNSKDNLGIAITNMSKI